MGKKGNKSLWWKIGEGLLYHNVSILDIGLRALHPDVKGSEVEKNKGLNSTNQSRRLGNRRGGGRPVEPAKKSHLRKAH